MTEVQLPYANVDANAHVKATQLCEDCHKYCDKFYVKLFKGICSDCYYGRVESFRNLLCSHNAANPVTVEDVASRLQDPRFPFDSLGMTPIDWAAYTNNLPVLRLLLNDSRFHYRDYAIIPCIMHGYTDIVKELIAGTKHYGYRVLGEYLVCASMTGNTELVHLLRSVYRVPEQYDLTICYPTPANSAQLCGALLCFKCSTPTTSFLRSHLQPICITCAEHPEDYCMYCHNRKYSNMDRCSMHTELSLLTWDPVQCTFVSAGEPHLTKTKCSIRECENHDVQWTRIDSKPNGYRLLCQSCLTSKKYCKICCGYNRSFLDTSHTCEHTYALCDGLFYENP